MTKRMYEWGITVPLITVTVLLLFYRVRNPEATSGELWGLFGWMIALAGATTFALVAVYIYTYPPPKGATRPSAATEFISPVGGGAPVNPLVYADLDQLVNVPIANQIKADLAERAAFGLKKYGKPLTTHNGRNAMVDIYQELLDAVVYYRQLLEEGVDDHWINERDVRLMYKRAINDCATWRAVLSKKERARAAAYMSRKQAERDRSTIGG